jgi:hypothetical protein
MHSNSIGSKSIQVNVLGKANVRYIEGANVVGVDLLILMHKMILL